MSFPNGYNYRQTVTVDNANIGADLAAFVVSIIGTYDFLAHTDHGGKVTSESGFDIAFSVDTAGETLIYPEIESYDHETGEVVLHVPMDLDTDADTVFYIWYGNSSITTSQYSAATVWDADFVSVYHHATTGGTDALGTNNLSSATGTPDAVTGKIGGGLYTNNEDLYKDSPTGLPSGSAARTYSKWVKLGSSGQNGVSLGGWGDFGTNDATFAFWTYIGAMSVYMNPGQVTVDWTQDTSWHLWHITYPSAGAASSIKIYKDGQLQTNTGSGGSVNTTLTQISCGQLPNAASGGNFTQDEERIASVVRSAEWIAAEYANQNDPSTFYTFSDEESGIDYGTLSYLFSLNLEGYLPITGTGNISYFISLISEGYLPITATGGISYTISLAAAGYLPITGNAALSYLYNLLSEGFIPPTGTGGLSYTYQLSASGQELFIASGGLTYQIRLSGSGRFINSTGGLIFTFNQTGSGTVTYSIAQLVYLMSLAGSGKLEIIGSGLLGPFTFQMNSEGYMHNIDSNYEEYLRRYINDPFGLVVDQSPVTPTYEEIPDELVEAAPD